MFIALEETLTFSKGMSHVIHLTTQESKADGDLLSIIAAAVHNIHYCQYTHWSPAEVPYC